MRTPLFVYGSLLSGLAHAQRLGGRQRQPGTVAGALWLLPRGSYPTLLQGDGLVRGELVDLGDDPLLLAGLDDFEGVASGLYQRARREATTLADGRRRQAWVYLCPPGREAEVRRAGAGPIPGGDWRAALTRRSG